MGIVSWTAQAMGAPLFGFLLVVVLLAVALWPQRRERPPTDATTSGEAAAPKRWTDAD